MTPASLGLTIAAAASAWAGRNEHGTVLLVSADGATVHLHGTPGELLALLGPVMERLRVLAGEELVAS